METSDSDDRSLLDALSRHVLARPDAPAYRTGDKVLTFADVERVTNRIANALVAMRVARGDRIACLTKRHTECLLLMLATCKVGAVCLPVNWRLAANEVEFIVEHGQARLMMADASFIPTLVAGIPPSACKVVCTDGRPDGFDSLVDWYQDHADTFVPVHSDPDDAVLQIYSSGTTGQPKGVVLTHRGLLSTSRTTAQDWKFDDQCVMGNPLPTFHVAGMTMLLMTLFAGGQTSAFAEFDASTFIHDIAGHRITHSFLVPAMLLFMLQQPDANKADYSSLRLIAYGGSPITETVLHDVITTFKCDLYQIYGLTEVSGPATALLPEDHRLEGLKPELLRSAGKPMNGTRVRIVDPATGEDLPDGDAGEIWIESIRNFKEYWRDPQATLRAYPEGRNDKGGWMSTGDGGYMKDGYLYIHDRIKDMVISGGENIYPAEVENLLAKHPGVGEAAVIGVPDAKWGEAVKACVVLRPGALATEREIIDWMRERMAHYKCPKSIDFVESLPRTPSGKVLKRTLREPYWKGRGRDVA